MNSRALASKFASALPSGASSGAAWMAAFGVAWWAAWIFQLRGEWSLNPQYFHGWGVPFLAAYLFLKRWERRPEADRKLNRKACLALAALALAAWGALWVVRIPNMDWRLLDWGLSLCAVGLMLAVLGMLGGRAWVRHFAVPVLFVLLAVPWLTRVETGFVLGLTRLIVLATTEVALWIGWPAWSSGNVIHLPSGTVGVEEACSGVRSFQGTLMASVFFGELHRLRLAGRAFIVLAGLAAALVLNFFRTLALTIVAGNWGNGAVARWHDVTGYMVLGLSFAVLWLLVWLLVRFVPSALESSLPGPKSAGGDFRKVVRRPGRAPGLAMPSKFAFAGGLAFMAAVVFSSAAWYRPAAKTGDAQPNWTMAWPKDPLLQMRDIPEGIQSVLRYNVGEYATWKPDPSTEWWIYYFGWSPKTPGAHLAAFHSPEVCLPSVGIKLKEHVGVYEFSRPGVDLAFNVYRFERSGTPLFVFFAYWQEGMRFGTGDFLSRTGYRLGLEPKDRLDRVRRGLSLGEQRVLEAAVAGPRDAREAIARFEEFLSRSIVVPQS